MLLLMVQMNYRCILCAGLRPKTKSMPGQMRMSLWHPQQGLTHSRSGFLAGGSQEPFLAMPRWCLMWSWWMSRASRRRSTQQSMGCLLLCGQGSRRPVLHLSVGGPSNIRSKIGACSWSMSGSGVHTEIIREAVGVQEVWARADHSSTTTESIV